MKENLIKLAMILAAGLGIKAAEAIADKYEINVIVDPKLKKDLAKVATYTTVDIVSSLLDK